MQRDNYSATKSMSCPLGDGPANALALSKDYTHVVVAGRNVFKILAIDEDGFVEKVNLRVGKNLNLNYSCNDVAWSSLDENLIATGATNGAVVLWNLSKTTRAKQEHVFADHQRTVHKIVFHPTDPSILLSGSQDGTVKCFDLRTTEAKLTFKSNSDCVRDVQFVPKNSFSFTSVSENGSVQLWDVRKGGERPFLTFSAHSGPVFTCDWHPETPSILATGGRDRAIKIWTVTNIAILEHSIQTVASVGRIKWRPQRKNHIGSTSLVVDASVCVWDVRRPFVPFAAFEKHKDVATGIAWKNSPHIFLSTSKDCTVWQNVFRDAVRPASKAIPQALALNLTRGEIAQAVTVQTLENSSAPRQRSGSLDENFHLAQSRLFLFETKLIKDPFRVECAERKAKIRKLLGRISGRIIRPSDFSIFAFLRVHNNILVLSQILKIIRPDIRGIPRNYILNGKSAIEMCEKNAEVAMQLSLHQAALVWEISKLYCQILTQSTSETVKSSDPVMTTPPKDDHEDPNLSDDDANNNSSSETEKQDLLAEIASGLHMNQNLFMPPAHSYEFNYDVQQDWQVLPAEAFQPRHEIREGSSPPMHLEDCSPRDLDEHLETVAIENRTSQLRILKMDPVPEFDFSIPIIKALHYHANKGDVQTAVCAWLVLSTVCDLKIEKRIVEAWCWIYIELLERHRLHAEAALVIKLSDVLGHLSQQSTSYLISCGQCGRPMPTGSGNFCAKCQKAVARCSICHATISGLISWCQGCGHGGHASHLTLWFSKHDECPVGCGHVCNA